MPCLSRPRLGRHVVGGVLAPLAAGIHEEAENFGIVVPMSPQNVEGSASCQFAEFPAVTRDAKERVGDTTAFLKNNRDVE